MRIKITSILRRTWISFAVFLTLMTSLIGIGVAQNNSAYAEPIDTPVPATVQTDEESSATTENTENTGNQTNTENTENTDNSEGTTVNNSSSDVAAGSCKSSLGAIGWIICPVIEKVSDAVDWLYGKIEDILQIDPIPAEDGSPIYEIWKYCLGVTNVIFIIFFLIVIYSQLTGWGITNYGLKKALPKLIVMAITVNLSFLICSLAVDVSNVVGHGLRSVFATVEQAALANASTSVDATTMTVSMAKMYTSMAGGTALAIGGGMIAFELGAIWMLIPTVLGAIVAVATGLITVALRQAVVMLLVMISPLAFVANIMPNTEGLFKKWKGLLTRMLVFYPMFSLLFGASSLAGFAIIMSAKDGFGLLLGVAVQIFPLFFSWKLMQMSGTFLGDINTRLRALTAKPLAVNRAWADSHRQLTRQKRLATGVTPSARLMQFLSNRRIAREEETKELAETSQLRGQYYAAMRNYNRKTGLPSHEGEEAYARQARNMRYQQGIDWHKNNMNKGLGQLEVVQANASTAQKARLKQLDIANVVAADKLKIEKARGEKIEYENAMSFHKRMEDAVNAHLDDVHEKESTYKRHDIKDRASARARYATMQDMMEHDVQGIHYAAATAAHGYDTQKKIVETKMQKYFDLTPPTRDVELRLTELTKGKNAIDDVDSIISGLRVLNQRGDTDLVKKYMEELLDHKVKLGTHASQALASFLMFEVKDNDPWLRRFGKYINLETANVYNKNRRKVMEVTYDEYIKGYHDGEPESEIAPGGRMRAKKDMKSLSEGTSLDNIERTALSNLDESLKKAYGYDENEPGKAWDVAGWLKKREEIQTAFEPAFLSASLKWLSGSEQINSGVKFWTGYDQSLEPAWAKKTDENGDEVSPFMGTVRNDDGSIGIKDYTGEVEKYFRRKTRDYFKDQTTGQILAMRTDYREPTMEHLLQSYLDDDGLTKEEKLERLREYNEARAEIQTRKYADKKTPEEKEKARAADLRKLRMAFAGRQLRKILGETGKLEQIYRTRRSGAANNAKDWLREWIGLDDEEAMYDEVKFYEHQRKMKQAAASDSGSDDSSLVRIYDAETRSGIRDSLERIWEDHKDVSGAQFYDIATEAIRDWFGEGETVVGRLFKEYYERKTKSGEPDAYDLKKYLEDLLHDPNNYPDA